jgi:hypothetical protein
MPTDVMLTAKDLDLFVEKLCVLSTGQGMSSRATDCVKTPFMVSFGVAQDRGLTTNECRTLQIKHLARPELRLS